MFIKPRCSHQIQIFLKNIINRSSLVVTLFQEYNNFKFDNILLTKPILCFSNFYNGHLQSRSCRYSYFEQDLRKTPYDKEIVVILNTDILEVFLDLLTTSGVYDVKLRIVGTTAQQLGHLQTIFPELLLEMSDTSKLTFTMMELISMRIQDMQKTR